MAETMAKIIDRLKAWERPTSRSVTDIDTIDEMARGIRRRLGISIASSRRAPELAVEIAELEGYRTRDGVASMF